MTDDKKIEDTKIDEKEELSGFHKLVSLDVSGYTEKKNDLTYLSWANAWREFCKVYPEAEYDIHGWDGKPYFYDDKLGYLVGTVVRNGKGETKRMYLPVMDSSNKAMKAEKYSYKVKEYKFGKPTGNFIDRDVQAATMFDINTALMRCLTKNLALFGLGLYIYAGEDLPEQHLSDKDEKGVVINNNTTTTTPEVNQVPPVINRNDPNYGRPKSYSERIAESKATKISTPQDSNGWYSFNCDTCGQTKNTQKLKKDGTRYTTCWQCNDKKEYPSSSNIVQPNYQVANDYKDKTNGKDDGEVIENTTYRERLVENTEQLVIDEELKDIPF